MKNLLFVCTFNEHRSKTGETLYKDDPRFRVKSAGISRDAQIPLTKEALIWADIVFVFEKSHSEFISRYFPLFTKKVVYLGIENAYYYMDEELVSLIKENVEKVV